MRDRRAWVSRRAERRARYSSAGAMDIRRLSRERAGEFAGVAGPPNDGLVEKADERRDAAEHREQFRIETRADREVRRIFAPADELPVAQVIGGRVILQVAAGHARQLIAAEPADGRSKGRRRDHAMELPMIVRNGGADRVQFG